MEVPSNETRKHQLGHENAQRAEKNLQGSGPDTPNEANAQTRNKKGEGCEIDMGKAEQGQHCGEQGQQKTQPQQKGQTPPQHQHK
jgi:hypothetical protein